MVEDAPCRRRLVGVSGVSNQMASVPANGRPDAIMPDAVKPNTRLPTRAAQIPHGTHTFRNIPLAKRDMGKRILILLFLHHRALYVNKGNGSDAKEMGRLRGKDMQM